MFKIHCLNAISPAGLNLLTPQYQLVEDFAAADAVLVRSAGMHELEFAPHLVAIARAGAGVNNIPLDRCAEQGIVVFNTPGANANGVKELVIGALILASRNIIDGVNWVQSLVEDPDLPKLVEKHKSQFSGIEIQGKKLGVVGLGAVGLLVANAAIKLGMEVYGYDPYISVEGAWKLSKHVIHARSLEEIFRECDFITLHTPLTGDTRGMLNKDAFAVMKDGVRILNFARAELVVDDDIMAALEQGKVSCYVTDFPNPRISPVKGVISIPHLGASTVESEENCAVMAVQQLMDYLENGNIKNSVNYPECDMGPCTHAGRIAINHRNIPNMLGQLTAILGQENYNIANLTNKSKGQWAYTMIDVDCPVSREMVAKISQIPGVARVRVIK
ncbi:MAG TPA: phosphoglycerate dehydrogenase [Clostridia bacterium]|nr:phosphoglycerate dehydrogenase [Clostridia bacterium]